MAIPFTEVKLLSKEYVSLYGFKFSESISESDRKALIKAHRDGPLQFVNKMEELEIGLDTTWGDFVITAFVAILRSDLTERPFIPLLMKELREARRHLRQQ